MNILKRGKETLILESENLKTIADNLDSTFVNAVEVLYNTKGRIITSGVGKSGHIARKAASTFASTGTPSFFVDPTDCVHGDFGMITKDDYVILYSKGGESREIIEIVSWLCRQHINYIAITADEKSTLAKNAEFVLSLHMIEEACPLNLAPTVSTTASIALSDALATGLMDRRGFRKEDFAVYHPAGSLGKQLAKVDRIMHKDNLPTVSSNDNLHDVLFNIIEHKLGMAIVVENNILQGLIVDGDLKRLLIESNTDVLKMLAKDLMNKKPLTITKDTLIGEAISIMEGKVTALVVVEKSESGDVPIGVLHIHDILKFKAL